MKESSMPRVPLTKIVATIGPATSSPEQIDALIDAGVDIIRMNFSHGTHDDHQHVYNAVRKTAEQKGRQIAILQDLQGPKLRVGELIDGGPVMLQDDNEFRICTSPVAGTAFRVSTSYQHLGRDIQPGDAVLLDDGSIELQVEHIEYDTDFGDDIVTTVVHGGALKPHKGINLPGTVISAPSLTGKDMEDLAFGVSLGVDLIALSFVREASDIENAKSRIHALGGTQPVIAKIEKPQAVAKVGS